MKTAKGSAAPLIFTTYDIGRMTGTDPTTVHKWIDKGLLRGYRTPGGHRRVRAEDLRGFLASHGIPLPKELGGGEALRVMVVDGEVESLRATAKVLKKLKPGWNVITAETGVEALLGFAGGTPDVLVYDLAIADTDGFSLFKQLRDRDETSAMKVLAVAGSGADVQKRATAAGASACLKKPLGAQDLVAAIELATGLRPVLQA